MKKRLTDVHRCLIHDTKTTGKPQTPLQNSLINNENLMGQEVHETYQIQYLTKYVQWQKYQREEKYQC